jgi:pantetheine-phosphate adenylyltransferase
MRKMLGEKYVVALGGTFDHIHEGHKYLLDIAFTIAKKVIIGLSNGVLLSCKEYKQLIEPFEVRKSFLYAIAGGYGFITDEQIEIFELQNIYGKLDTEENIDILIVSEEKKENAYQINKVRKSNGLNPLLLLIVPILLDDNGERFNSTRIREKEYAKSAL